MSDYSMSDFKPDDAKEELPALDKKTNIIIPHKDILPSQMLFTIKTTGIVFY